jgi:hypothetical protein
MTSAGMLGSWPSAADDAPAALRRPARNAQGVSLSCIEVAARQGPDADTGIETGFQFFT